MVNLTGFIKRNPLLTFFILTFTFSWVLFLIYILIPNDFSLILIILAIYTPAYSALIISKISGNKESNNNSLIKWITFLIIWVIATITFIFNYLIKVANFSLIIIIGAIFLGLLPSIAISSGFSQNPDIKMVFQTYIKPKGHFGFYVFAILYVPIVLLIGIAITLVLGQPVIWMDLPSGVELFGLIILTILYTFFLEEALMKSPVGVVLHYLNCN